MTSKGSWSELPTDALQIICEKLVDVKDYVRFGAVCSSWRSAVWLSRYQVPVLMLPNSSSSYDNSSFQYTHTFFSIREDLHVPVLPAVTSEYISSCGLFGLGNGWLLIKKDIRNPLGRPLLQLQLWNPFLSPVMIKLPSLPGNFIAKATLSNNPTSASDYVVMVIYYLNFQGNGSRLAFFKTGDKSWTCINYHPNSYWNHEYDIIFYKDRFYALCSFEMVSLDISSRKPKLTRMASPPTHIFSYQHFDNQCLMESSGDLLCVARQVVRVENNIPSTVGFRIFKFLTNESKWTELKTLQGRTLFLDEKTSFSVLSSDFHQCKSNHIYFAYSRHDAGMFNLEESSLKPLFSGNMINERVHRPVWVQPTLKNTPWVQPTLNNKKKQEHHYVGKLFRMITCMKE